jgi:hypothetical protein
MKKLETIEDLVKAVGAFAGHFKKASAHHAALAAAHGAHAEFCKAKHEAMPDDHEHKAYFGKVAAHHTVKAALHKAHSEHLEEMANAIPEEKEAAVKVAAAEEKKEIPITPSSDGVAELVKKTTDELVTKSLEMIKTDPTVQETIKEMVLKGVREALGEKIIPDGVQATFRTVAPSPGLKLIPRPGSAPIEAGNMDPSLQKMVGAS